MVTDKADIHTNIYLESDSVYALGLLKKYLTTTWKVTRIVMTANSTTHTHSIILSRIFFADSMSHDPAFYKSLLVGKAANFLV